MKKILFAISSLILFSCTTQHIETSKWNNSRPPAKQSLIYSLPQTNIMVTVEITKTTVHRGPYAEYAQKYLNILNVPMADYQNFAISDIKIHPQNEADPSQTYSITFSRFPEKINNLFAVSNKGIILDFTNALQANFSKSISATPSEQMIFDPRLMDDMKKEKVDTFYKTVMTDSSFVRIPIFKKQIEAKTTDDLAKEVSKELIKTRKRRLKILRGEYDFHPDGAALKEMVTELNKYEEQLMYMFAGFKQTEKLYYTFSFVPNSETLSKDLFYFHPDKGMLDQNSTGASVISVQVNKEQDLSQGVVPDKTSNTLYVRAPVMATVLVKRDDKLMVSSRLPVYQFGPVQVMPLK